MHHSDLLPGMTTNVSWFFCHRCTDQALFKETVVEVAPNVFVRKAYPEPGFTPVASLMYTHYIPTVSSHVYRF